MKWIRRSFCAASLCSMLLVIAIVVPNIAGAESGFARTGPYVGLGVGLGLDNFDISENFDLKAAYGFNAWGGYRFHRHLAAELQLEYLNGFDTKGNTQIPDVSAQVVTFTGNVKLYVLTGQAQPYLQVGVGIGSEQFGDARWVSATAARFGGGFDFYFSDNWVVQFAPTYVLQTGSLDGGDYVSINFGAQYRF